MSDKTDKETKIETSTEGTKENLPQKKEISTNQQNCRIAIATILAVILTRFFGERIDYPLDRIIFLTFEVAIFFITIISLAISKYNILTISFIGLIIPIVFIGPVRDCQNQKHLERDETICRSFLELREGKPIIWINEIATKKYLSDKVEGWKDIATKRWTEDGKQYYLLDPLKIPGGRLRFKHFVKTYNYSIPQPSKDLVSEPNAVDPNEK